MVTKNVAQSRNMVDRVDIALCHALLLSGGDEQAARNR